MDPISIAIIKFMEFMGVTSGGLLVAAVILSYVIWNNRQCKKAQVEQDEKIKEFERKLERQEDKQSQKIQKFEDDQSSKLEKIYDRVRKVENEQADQHRRMDVHAEHFDVQRMDVDQAKEQAHKATLLCLSVVKSLKDLVNTP